MKVTLIVLTVFAALSSAILLWLIRHPKTPRALDFGDLRALIPDGNEAKAGYDVALLIIPFFTAGLGTNILSHVVLSQRDYAGTMNTAAIGKEIGRWGLILVGIVFPPILVGYAIYLKLQGRPRLKRNA